MTDDQADVVAIPPPNPPEFLYVVRRVFDGKGPAYAYPTAREALLEEGSRCQDRMLVVKYALVEQREYATTVTPGDALQGGAS
jgi:hypothetical protein